MPDLLVPGLDAAKSAAVVLFARWPAACCAVVAKDLWRQQVTLPGVVRHDLEL